ncbi:molecular chaperone HtpG [Chitinivibrio alkaliphilus]|uniref:Chaperone protein HtpG n=1 Tax=Chitinivibrio alkaliphilus ACht1 TaxID=1313304 RepID=U7D7N6_9BACT|nr:molecular chaperone HtpG [Chitinivibrio alkaliphilus]ERP38965.1 heat shock protein 90 [Chitinivibrio alkaliphilus ACht1]
MAEKMEFKSEAKQLLNLVIHSLYSNKEIFLRELISNASDALDKLRFLSLTEEGVSVDPESLRIEVRSDKENKRITISDNGIGMDRDDLIQNIGTIASSGSKAFLEKLSGDQKNDSNLIGQFGVGFYSAFMVAGKVEVVSKKVGNDTAYRWSSEGDTTFEIEEAGRLESGTDIIVHLTDEYADYAENWKLRSIISKHSNFVAFPVMLESTDEEKKGELEQINETKPLWLKDSKEVEEADYEDFFSSACGGFGKPMKTIHTSAEGVMSYKSLLFIPQSLSPFEMNNIERKHGVKLYVKRVFIDDNVKDIIPEYFRFVKGVVDTDDLPLNVSREMIQENPVVRKIGKALTNKLFSEIKKMAKKKPEEFSKFWNEFGQIIKEGLHTDYENREKLLEIVRFNSTAGDSAEYRTSFDEYVERMKEGQKHIYYLCGEDYESLSNSPHLELFKQKEIEVMLLTDPIDQFVFPGLGTVKEKELKSVTAGDLDLGDLDKDEKEKEEQEEKRLKKFLGRVKNILDDSVSDVKVTTRLTDSPSCLVAGEGTMNPQMEQMMRAMGQEVPESKRVLELNGTHPIVNSLNELYKNDPQGESLQEWVTLLYEQALIAEGGKVPDQGAYLRRVNGLLQDALKK